MLSEMQERLREEYDAENTNIGLDLSIDGVVYSYGLLEQLCMMEMEIWG